MARRTSKTKTETQLAVDFIGSFINKVDYCRFYEGELIYNDSIISIGYPVSFNHNMVLDAKAVKACAALFDQKATFTIDKTLQIDTDKKRASIAIGDDTDVLYVLKDQPTDEIDQDFIDALALAAKATREGDQRVLVASVLLLPYTAIGTDSHAFIEALHGKAIANLPVMGIRIPTSFVTKLSKVKLKPVSIGVSNVSLTVYYENGAWLKSQLYLDEVKTDLTQVTAQMDKAQYVDLPDDLLELFNESLAFEGKDTIKITQTELQVVNSNGSKLHIKTNTNLVTKDVCTTGKNIQILNKLPVTKYDFYSNDRMLIVRGDRFRGALSTVRDHS